MSGRRGRRPWLTQAQGCGQQQAVRAWAVNWRGAGPPAPALLLTSQSVPWRPLSTEAGSPGYGSTGLESWCPQLGGQLCTSEAAGPAELSVVLHVQTWTPAGSCDQPCSTGLPPLLTRCWISGDITGPAISPGASAPRPAQGPSAARPWGLLTVPLWVEKCSRPD